MKTPSKYYIEVTSATYTGDDLADYLENGPLYRDDEGTASDVTCEVAALRAENERLAEAAQVASDLLSAVHPKDSQSIYLIERVRALMEDSK